MFLFFLSETSFVDGSGLRTGSDFGLLPIPLLALALLMIPMIMMPMMSSVTSESSIAVAPIPVVSTPVLVTVPSTQAAVQTTSKYFLESKSLETFVVVKFYQQQY